MTTADLLPFPWWPSLLPEMRDEVRAWMRRAQRIMLAMTCRDEWKRLVASDPVTGLCAQPPPLRTALLVAEEYDLAYKQACQRRERNPWHGQLGAGGDFHLLVIQEHPCFYERLIAGVTARECPLVLMPCKECLVSLGHLPKEYDSLIYARFLAYDNAIYEASDPTGRHRIQSDTAEDYLRYFSPELCYSLRRERNVFWRDNSVRCHRQGCLRLLPRNMILQRSCMDCAWHFCDYHMAGSAVRRYFCRNTACTRCFYGNVSYEYRQKPGLRCAPCLDKSDVPRCHTCKIPLCDNLRDKGPCPQCNGPSRMPLTPPSYDDDEEEEEEDLLYQ